MTLHSGANQPLHQAADGQRRADADADLLEVIAWAVDTSSISSDEAELLPRVYLPDPQQERRSSDIANELNLSPRHCGNGAAEPAASSKPSGPMRSDPPRSLASVA